MPITLIIPSKKPNLKNSLMSQRATDQQTLFCPCYHTEIFKITRLYTVKISFI